MNTPTQRETELKGYGLAGAPEAPQEQMFATPYGKVSATKLISALNAVEMLPEIKAQRDELLAACKAHPDNYNVQVACGPERKEGETLAQYLTRTSTKPITTDADLSQHARVLASYIQERDQYKAHAERLAEALKVAQGYIVNGKSGADQRHAHRVVAEALMNWFNQ